MKLKRGIAIKPLLFKTEELYLFRLIDSKTF